MDEFPKEVLRARKVTGFVRIPDEVLMDRGFLDDTRPKRPPLRTRARLRVALWRIRIGELVAGQNFHDDELTW